jgi:AraC family transcriptional regulator, transcriptional activator of the genes for pyochelin and ferripyochelin receptors
MPTTISQQDYWDLFTEVEKNSPQIDFTDVTYTYPSQLGKGCCRFIQLRSGLELSIECYQLHDRLIMQQCDRSHPLEMEFKISGQNYDGDDLLSAGQTRFYGSGLAPGGQLQENALQPVTSINVHLEPELVADFWGENNRDLQENWQHLFRSQQPYFVFAGSITPAMQIALQQILNCPYQGAIARMYLEGKVWELMALQLAQMTQERDRTSQYPLKSKEKDRLYLARKILGDRLDNPPSLSNLARQIGLNECTLKRGFRQLFGTTVFGYLYQQRMEYARQLLLEGEMNVAQVSRMVGYASQSRFATAFRKKFGVNPKVFMRQF